MSALLSALRHPVPTATVRTCEGLRVVRMAVVVVGLHRAINLTTVLAGGAGITTASMAVAFTASAVWGGVLVWGSWQRGAFRRGLAVVDVMLAAAIGLLALTWGPTGMRFSTGVLQGAAIVAGCALPIGALAVAVTALVGVKYPAVLVPAEYGRITVNECLAYAATLAVLAFAAAVGHRLLRLAADAVDRRHTGPAEQRRVLHDTALATLTAIATGRLDARADQVRARCARDATYLRLIMHGEPTDPGGLPTALAAAASEAVAVGLRVHPMCTELPDDLDPSVVSAIAMAVREVLNNVHRHAGTNQVWLTAAHEDRRIVVRVVDRGAGFIPDRITAGSGIRDSIVGRMREIGGSARVESAPGDGTCVELRWPR